MKRSFDYLQRGRIVAAIEAMKRGAPVHGIGAMVQAAGLAPRPTGKPQPSAADRVRRARVAALGKLPPKPAPQSRAVQQAKLRALISGGRQ